MFSLALAVSSLVVAGQTAPALPADHPAVAPKPAMAAPAEAALPQGHPPTAPAASAPSSETLLRQLDSTPGLREKEKSFEVAANIARLYYSSGRARDSLPYFEQAGAQARDLRSALLAEKKREVPAAAPESCGLSGATPMAERAGVVKGKGAACLRAAIAPALDLQALHGQALFLAGESGQALAAFESVLALDARQEDALFGRSALLYETRSDDVKALREALQGLQRFLTEHPNSPRTRLASRLVPQLEQAIAAGGVSAVNRSRSEDRKVRLSQKVQPQPPGSDGPPALTREMVDAVKNTERTPELEQGLGKLVEEGEEHLARGRYPEALAAYTRVVPFQPENGRAKAGMAWALVGLKRPMADRVWGVAVSSDPAAVEKLGDTLLAKQDAPGARALWTKLAASAPEYPGKAGLAAKAR